MAVVWRFSKPASRHIYARRPINLRSIVHGTSDSIRERFRKIVEEIPGRVGGEISPQTPEAARDVEHVGWRCFIFTTAPYK
jgi:hypothetical protein